VVFRSQPTPESLALFRRRLSSGSTFLQSLTRTLLVSASPEGDRPPTPLMSFRSLQHSPAKRIHSTRACHTRYGPPPGFGYPPDGLRPSTPGRPCFMPTALLGFLTPFEAFPSRKVPKAITPRGGPACRFTRRFAGDTRRHHPPARPASTSGLRPFRESLERRHRLMPHRTGCSLGLRPF
jgi:hypothetical protein